MLDAQPAAAAKEALPTAKRTHTKTPLAHTFLQIFNHKHFNIFCHTLTFATQPVCVCARAYVCVCVCGCPLSQPGSHLKALATILKLLSVFFEPLPFATFCQNKRGPQPLPAIHTHTRAHTQTHMQNEPSTNRPGTFQLAEMSVNCALIQTGKQPVNWAANINVFDLRPQAGD